MLSRDVDVTITAWPTVELTVGAGGKLIFDSTVSGSAMDATSLHSADRSQINPRARTGNDRALAGGPLECGNLLLLFKTGGGKGEIMEGLGMKSTTRTVFICFLIAAASVCGDVGAAEAMRAGVAEANSPTGFYLKDGDRVVLFGDSITNQRFYTMYVETYVTTRFPKLKIQWIVAGQDGDSVDNNIRNGQRLERGGRFPARRRS